MCLQHKIFQIEAPLQFRMARHESTMNNTGSQSWGCGIKLTLLLVGWNDNGSCEIGQLQCAGCLVCKLEGYAPSPHSFYSGPLGGRRCNSSKHGRITAAAIRVRHGLNPGPTPSKRRVLKSLNVNFSHKCSDRLYLSDCFPVRD